MKKYTYTEVPSDVFEHLLKNSGVTLREFDPSNPKTGDDLREDILWATSGGVNITCVPQTEDMGDGIDNMPLNTKELLEVTGYEVTYSGTSLTFNPETIASMIGAADVSDEDDNGVVKITPRTVLEDSDFKSLWHLTDYGNGGWVAMHIINAFSTGGLSYQSTDKGKGEGSFTYTGMSTIDDISLVPIEIFVKAGTDEETEE